MRISPFFLNLRSAYRAELEDLTFDTDGRDVLRQRLTEKRGQMPFLVQMLELSPEMVAVVFHQGLAFPQPAVMDHLIGQEADALPEWSTLAASVGMTPWAHDLAAVVLKAPAGEWFMSLVAGLHYLAGKPVGAPGMHDASQADDASENDDETDGEEGDAEGEGNHDHEDDGDSEDSPRGARARKEAGDDWLAAQGFDRKD